MIDVYEEQIIIDYAKAYRKKTEIISDLKDKLDSLKEEITEEITNLESLRNKELEFLDQLKDKYNCSKEQIIHIVQKIVMDNSSLK